MINHHGKAIAARPFLRTVSEHQMDENGRNGGTSVMTFFGNKVKDGSQESSPTPSVPLVKDILKAKNLNISDLISRKEEVSGKLKQRIDVRCRMRLLPVRACTGGPMRGGAPSSC